MTRLLFPRRITFPIRFFFKLQPKAGIHHSLVPAMELRALKALSMQCHRRDVRSNARPWLGHAWSSCVGAIIFHLYLSRNTQDRGEVPEISTSDSAKVLVCLSGLSETSLERFLL